MKSSPMNLKLLLASAALSGIRYVPEGMATTGTPVLKSSRAHTPNTGVRSAQRAAKSRRNVRARSAK